MINLLDIHVSFDGQSALEGLSLTVMDGTLLGIIGPGGSGKSTLCRVICGLVEPQSGMVMINKVNLDSVGRKGLEEIQKQIGVQFQNDALFEHMTVLQNVEYPLFRLTNQNPTEVEMRAIERIAMVGLSGFENRFPRNLSGGQRKRVALARACVTEPPILICDDPTAGLDPVTSRQILDMIAGIRYQTKSTVIVVSSDVVGLLSVSQRIALVWEGNIIEEDTPSGFRLSTRPEVQRFLNDAKLPFQGWTWD